jgi:hypothetical protein
MDYEGSHTRISTNCNAIAKGWSCGALVRRDEQYSRRNRRDVNTLYNKAGILVPMPVRCASQLSHCFKALE